MNSALTHRKYPRPRGAHAVCCNGDQNNVHVKERSTSSTRSLQRRTNTADKLIARSVLTPKQITMLQIKSLSKNCADGETAAAQIGKNTVASFMAGPRPSLGKRQRTLPDRLLYPHLLQMQTNRTGPMQRSYSKYSLPTTTRESSDLSKLHHPHQIPSERPLNSRVVWTKPDHPVDKNWFTDDSSPAKTCAIHGQLKNCSCISRKQFPFNDSPRLPEDFRPTILTRPVRYLHTYLPTPLPEDDSSGDENEALSKNRLKEKRYFHPNELSSEDRSVAYVRHNLILGNVRPPETVLNNTVFIRRWLTAAENEKPLFPSLQ